ncbi:MAG: 3-deoxy-manno-octulosonate cytidylyltransferase [Chlorobi bacterium]|nr:3-deoxy-manno-octulosonate cytidylyltransferase [Chlorobiota bacterium]
MSNKVLGIIPARYASTRLPGKPLAMIGDKPMIQHVYENCRKTLQYVYIATDDERIADAVESFGGKVVMTGAYHRSGTERCAEAAKLASAIEKVNFDVIINIQGDEPFFDSEQLNDIQKCFEDRDTQIATLVNEIENNDQIFDEKEAKVILDNDGNAIYFSRSPIPFLQGVEKDKWAETHTFYRQIGIYGYRPGVLLEIVQLAPTPLEKAESLEQLRWIENGYKIKCGITGIEETMCVDTPEDLEKANELYKKLTNG